MKGNDKFKEEKQKQIERHFVEKEKTPNENQATNEFPQYNRTFEEPEGMSV